MILKVNRHNLPFAMNAAYQYGGWSAQVSLLLKSRTQPIIILSFIMYYVSMIALLRAPPTEYRYQYRSLMYSDQLCLFEAMVR